MHPYSTLVPVREGRPELKEAARLPGSALVWVLEQGVRKVDRMLVDHRPGGLALIVILPPIVDLANDPSVFRPLERSRPHGVLPFHGEFSPRELAQVLRRPPEDLGGCITEYLAWRGIGLDRGTVHLIRRTIDLSANLRSVCPHCPGASTCHGEPWAADSRNAAFLSHLTGFRSVGCFGSRLSSRTAMTTFSQSLTRPAHHSPLHRHQCQHTRGGGVAVPLTGSSSQIRTQLFSQRTRGGQRVKMSCLPEVEHPRAPRLVATVPKASLSGNIKFKCLQEDVSNTATRYHLSSFQHWRKKRPPAI